MEININAPNAILKITSGAMLTFWFIYVDSLVTISVLVGNDHPKIRRHVGF